MTRKQISIALIVVLNIGLLFAALVVESRIEFIQARTFEAPHGYRGFGALGLIVCLMALLSLRIFRKTLWKVSLGLAVLLTQLATFSIFHLNQTMASEGDFINGSIKNVNWYQNGDYNRFTITLSIIGLRHMTLEVDPEICVKVDSIQLRIDEGLFGLKVASTELRLIERKNCKTPSNFENYPIDSASHLTYHLELGDEYMNRRCFDNAIREFSVCIMNDTLESKYFNRRARVYLTQRDYNNAMTDYYQAALCEVYAIDSNLVNFADTMNYTQHIEQVFARTIKGDLENISENLERINQIERLSNYRYWMVYCYEQSLTQ